MLGGVLIGLLAWGTHLVLHRGLLLLRLASHVDLGVGLMLGLLLLPSSNLWRLLLKSLLPIGWLSLFQIYLPI